MMTSTSLTELYLSYGLKPCRVILERISVPEAVQTPAPAEPRKTRVKPLKLRNGETRSSLSRKKPSKVAPKATTRLRDPAGSPGNKEVTSEEPAQNATSDVVLGTCQTTETLRGRPSARTPPSLDCPPLGNLPCDCEAENASSSTEKERETCDPVGPTHQPEIVATNAGRSRCCRVTRRHPGGWRDATPAVDVPSGSDVFPSNVLEDIDKNRTSEEAAVIIQPPEIAKFFKRRRSQRSCSLPQKFPAFAPPLQACARLEELSCNHVAGSAAEKERETEDAVTFAPQSSRIHTKEAGRATRSCSQMEYSLTPALQDGASVEVLFGERAGDSEKKEAAIQASRTPKARKTRRRTPTWRHGLIRRRRSRRKLPFTPPASAVPLGHSEEPLVDPADCSEPPAEEILGIDNMAEEITEETAVMKLGDHLEEKQLPSDTKLGEQQTERGDYQAGTVEPPAVQGVIYRHAAKQISAEATGCELGIQERERPAEPADQSGGNHCAGEEPGDQPVPTSQESQAKAAGLKRRRRRRRKGLRVSRARGKGQQRRCGGSAGDAIGAEAVAGIVHLPAAEEAEPAAPVQETSLVKTYIEESVPAMGLDDVVADEGDIMVSLGEEQWAVISGEVVEPRPTRELYLERQDIPPMTQASKGKRKRSRRRKRKLTAPKRRGRPPKNPPAEPKKRGRPSKDSSAVPPVKCRGRARKNVSSTAPKRRGRPPKNAPQARESKGTLGCRPKSTPASSTGKRRPGRPRKERGVVAWIDPCSPVQDRAVVPWNPALGGDGDGDDSGWETTSNVSLYSSVWHFDRGFESSDDDRPARKKVPRKRRGSWKKACTEAQPPRKRGRPRKNPLEVVGSSKETSARGRATRGMKTPCPWNESAPLTLTKFLGESPLALPYDSDGDAGDAESDWETCSNVSVATIDANFEDMLLPGVDLDCPGPSRQEHAGFWPSIQGGELQWRCDYEQEESLEHFSDGEALSEDWETTSNASSGWNTELDAMLIPTDDSDHSGNYIVTEPEDQLMTYEELQSAFSRDEHGDSPVFLGNASPTEGSPEPYMVAEPVDDDGADEIPQEAAADLEWRDDHTEHATAFAGVRESDHERGDVVYPSEHPDGAGGDAPSQASVIFVSDSDATDSVCDSVAEHDSEIEAPVPPGISAAGGSAPEIIEISDDESDGNDGSSSQSAGPLVPSTEEVAGVEVPMETPALADTQTYTNTGIPPPASSDATTKDVQSLAAALCGAACDVRSSAGAQPRANASASGGLKDIEGACLPFADYSQQQTCGGTDALGRDDGPGGDCGIQ